jgi:DNA-binding winged helix-turn-helix (wHTH) protein/TolB-like protein
MDELNNRSDMPVDSPPVERYVLFGDFTVDLRDMVLKRRGEKVELPADAFQLLIYLIDRAGHIVPREELRDIWPTSDPQMFLDSLHTALTKIRAALEDNILDAKCVETLSEGGYRFVGQPERSDSESSESLNQQERARTKRARINKSLNQHESLNRREISYRKDHGPRTETAAEAGETLRSPMIRVGAASLITRRHAVLCAVALFLGSALSGMVVTLLLNSSAEATSSVHRTIVIHHFQNLTTDTREDSFCKGLGEELLAELNRKKTDSFEIVIDPDPPGKRALENSSGKASIFELEGSVRKEGHTLRIVIDLYELRSKRVMWAELYEGNDDSQVPVQRDVAMQVAKVILTRL